MASWIFLHLSSDRSTSISTASMPFSLTVNPPHSPRRSSTFTIQPTSSSDPVPTCLLLPTTDRNPVNGERARWSPSSVTLHSNVSLARLDPRVSLPLSRARRTRTRRTSVSWSTVNRPTCTAANRVPLERASGRNGKSGWMRGWIGTAIGMVLAKRTRMRMTSEGVGRSVKEGWFCKDVIVKKTNTSGTAYWTC